MVTLLASPMLRNIIAGAASVRLAPPGDYDTEKIHEKIANIMEVAKETGQTPEQVLAREFRERRLGQFLLTGLSVLALGLTLWGAIRGWPTYVLIFLAVSPGAMSITSMLITHKYGE